MKAVKYLLLSVTFALLSGCVAPSMVVSTRATGIEEGIVYSLPKQLVKVTYKRNTKDLKEKKVCEELIIKAEEPIPDTDNTFYATMEHGFMFSDALEISTKNGLLDGAIGHSEDKTGDIIVSLAGSLSGLFPSTFQPELMTPLPLPDTDPQKALECKGKPTISITQDIDPSKRKDVDALNSRLCSESIMLMLKVDPPRTMLVEPLKALFKAEGLIYRQPGTFTVKVKRTKLNGNKCECVGIDPTIQSVNLTLAQGGQIGILPLPRGGFSKNEYDFSFSDGNLSRSKTIQPSEALSAVNIIPNALKAMISVPAELLQLRVNYSTHEKELLELKKTMLEAQAEIKRKELELDEIKKRESKPEKGKDDE